MDGKLRQRDGRQIGTASWDDAMDGKLDDAMGGA
jgi:hypothetical protein